MKAWWLDGYHAAVAQKYLRHVWVNSFCVVVGKKTGFFIWNRTSYFEHMMRWGDENLEEVIVVGTTNGNRLPCAQTRWADPLKLSKRPLQKWSKSCPWSWRHEEATIQRKLRDDIHDSLKKLRSSGLTVGTIIYQANVFLILPHYIMQSNRQLPNIE